MATSEIHTKQDKARARNDARASTELRRRVLAGLPVEERRLRLNGVSTAVLESGEGPPVVLLHGPRECAAKWVRVLPGSR